MITRALVRKKCYESVINLLESWRFHTTLVAVSSPALIYRQRKKDVTLFRVSGSVDLLTVPDLRDHFRRAVDEGERNIILHLAGVTRISSAGIGAFMELYRDLLKKGGRVVMADISTPCVEVLKLTRLDRVFSMYSNEKEAFESFRHLSKTNSGTGNEAG